MFDVIDNVSLRIQMYDLLCRMPIFIRNILTFRFLYLYLHHYFEQITIRIIPL